jgi:hypothetical protein
MTIEKVLHEGLVPSPCYHYMIASHFVSSNTFFIEFVRIYELK